MATQLKNLKITSTDLVTQGANPDAHIRLFKRKDGDDIPDEGLLQKFIDFFKRGYADAGKEDVKKEAATFRENIDREQLRNLTSEMFDCCYALSDSLCSIICDRELDSEAKRDMMFKSLNEFNVVLRNAIPKWAKHKKLHGEDNDGVEISKSADQQAAFAKLRSEAEKAPGVEPPSETTGDSNATDSNINKSIQKEETSNMKFDKSKMTAEEQATLAEFEKKFGVQEDAQGATPPANVARRNRADPARRRRPPRTRKRRTRGRRLPLA